MFPRQVAYTPDGSKVFVTNLISGNVSVIDTSGPTVTAFITVGMLPGGIAVTPDGTQAWVCNLTSLNVSVIDIATSTVTVTIAVGASNTENIAFNPSGTLAYVTNNMVGSLSIIDVATKQVTATVTVGTNPGIIEFTDDGTRAYVGNSGSDNISVIDTATSMVTATIATPDAPTGIAFLTTFAPPPPPPPPPSPPSPPSSGGISLPSGATANEIAVLNYLNSLSNIPAIAAILADLAALSPNELLAALDSISPDRNATAYVGSTNAAFGLGSFIRNGVNQQRFVQGLRQGNAPLAAAFEEMGNLHLVASSKLAKLGTKQSAQKIDKKVSQANTDLRRNIWIQGFGDYAQVDGTRVNTGFDTYSAGGALGVDYLGEKAIVSFSGGYAYTHVNQDRNVGKSSANSYFLDLFTTFFGEDSYVELALLGAYNTYNQDRFVSFPGFRQTAKSSPDAFQLVPHFGLGFDFEFDWGRIEPYDSLDWAFVFESGFHEHGAAPLNMSQEHRNASVVRNELGINFYEFWEWCGGTIILQESAAYVYKNPFEIGKITASIVNAPGFFTVQSFNETQHLGLARLQFFYRSNSNWYTTVGYQGEFGSGTIFNAGEFTVGKYF